MSSGRSSSGVHPRYRFDSGRHRSRMKQALPPLRSTRSCWHTHGEWRGRKVCWRRCPCSYRSDRDRLFGVCVDPVVTVACPSSSAAIDRAGEGRSAAAADCIGAHGFFRAAERAADAFRSLFQSVLNCSSATNLQQRDGQADAHEAAERGVTRIHEEQDAQAELKANSSLQSQTHSDWRR